METSKYDLAISMHCPTCGTTGFSYTEGAELIKCASCGREMTRDELMRENSENIQEHADEIAKKAVAELGDELKKALRDTFKNNKFIKVK